MKKLLLGLLVAISSSSLINAQSNINIHSITTNRQPFGDGGYTLDGNKMPDSRAKLLNASYFGSTGIYNKTISIVDDYLNSGSLENIADSTNIDLFFFGTFDSLNFSLNAFTSAELDTLYNWSVRGGKLIIAGSSNYPQVNPTYLLNILNSRWGFEINLVNPTTIIPTVTGASSTIFNGPFGSIAAANQGAAAQGYFSTNPTNIVLLADDGAGNPTMYLDCATLDLVIADGDAYTSLGGISVGSGIINPNDMLLANTIAYMDELEGPPVITQNGNQLSTGTYNSYQWYVNGNMIPGANASTYTMTQPGSYSVQVPLACGCNNVASQSLTFVGVEEYAGQSPIYMSPNPVGNQGINFSGVTKQLTVSVFTVAGKLVDEFIVTPQKQHYNTEQLEKGVYFLQMYDMNGGFVSAKKLIRE